MWIGWVNFREIPLGTTDRDEAQRRLLNIAKERQHTAQRPAQDHDTAEKRRPYRVYPEGGRFVVKYYDDSGRRRKHWIPNTLIPPVTTEVEAEAYAAMWYRGELETQPLAAAATLAESANLDILNGSTTFEAFGVAWTSGKLAARFPDHVKRKSSSKQARRISPKELCLRADRRRACRRLRGTRRPRVGRTRCRWAPTSRTDISPGVTSTGASDCPSLADTRCLPGKASVCQSASQGLRTQGHE